MKEQTIRHPLLGDLDLNGNDNIQQSIRYKFREGFPISSEEVNDILDGYLHDLLTIISTHPATMNNLYVEMLKSINHVAAHLDNGKDKKVTKVQDGHTPNWRHI